MDHSRFRFLTKGLDTSSGLALLFRERELILRASLPPPMTTNVRAMITLALWVRGGGRNVSVRWNFTSRHIVSKLTPEDSYSIRQRLADIAC